MKNIGQLIKQISNILINDMNKRLNDYDLTFSQLQVLLTIKESANSICQKDLAEKLKVRHTTLIDILKILARKELIRKNTSKINAKYTEINLTYKGIETLQKMDIGKDKTEEMIAKTLGFMSVEEMIHKFDEVLKKLEEGLQYED